MLCIIVGFKDALDSNEEVHQSRNFGEWSNMVGYEMGSLLAGVYTTTKTPPAEYFKHG